jgi:uncharacterized membrane protein YdjX (TVP38/TMEM64 family)
MRVRQLVPSGYSAAQSTGLWRPLSSFLISWACAALIIPILCAFFNEKSKVFGHFRGVLLSRMGSVQRI